MRKILFRCFFVSFLFIGFLTTSAFAQSEERILSFHSDIQVHKDASMTVAETIKVYALGRDIKRGIYRDFPTIYKSKDGSQYRVGFHIVSIERDGHTETYHIENLSNGKRVYIGNKNVFLNSGEHTYRITYKTDGQLGFFKEHDELFWNVTGNGWIFPIDQASAMVHFPEGILENLIGTDGFTGVYGSTERSFLVEKRTEELLFQTTRGLRAKEGFTIVAAFPKGYIAKPIPKQVTPKKGISKEPRSPFKPQKGDWWLIGFFLVIFSYYYVAWVYVGMDPDKGTIIPLFYPPKKLSAQAVRYLWKMEFDNKILTTAIVQLAIKGVIKIDEKAKLIGRSYSIYRRQPLKELSKEDRWFAYFGSSTQLKSENYDKVQGALKDLKHNLKRDIQGIYFHMNRRYLYFGGFLSMAFSFYLFFMPSGMILPFSMFYLFSFGIGLGVMNIIFYYLIKAPTITGRKLMDQIEGFRMFLSATETQRLKGLGAPEKTPELYEEYLPYAIALDVERKWSNQFTDILTQAAYQPSWYHGHGDFYVRGFAHDLGHSFSNAISASSHAPGSSSGFGGGGFSGGGGGGGGGGGW